MTVQPLTKPCVVCLGTGLLPRPTIPLAEGDHTRRYVQNMPFAQQETCSRCGGTGVVPLEPTDVKEG